MTMGKASALTAGFIAAFGLGVWSGPHLMTSRIADSKTLDEIAMPFSGTRAASTAAATAPSAPAEKTAKAEPAPLPKVDVTAPALHRELKPLMYRGTDMAKAADGFSNAEQFATVAYASHNTGVPFVVLKHRVLNEGRTLTAAIRESQPAADATLEVDRARAEARSTILSIGS
jgi:hypothetical protein